MCYVNVTFMGGYDSHDVITLLIFDVFVIDVVFMT